MNDNKITWVNSLRKTFVLSIVCLAVAMGGVLLNAPGAEARAGFRLCYISTTTDGPMYFARKVTGLTPRNCSAMFVTYPDGKDRQGAKDVPTLGGVDYSKCEEFTEWKFTNLPNDGDICKFMKFEKDDASQVFTLDGLAELSGYALK